MKLEKLMTPGFILALTLLLANDFVFKTTFHNAITGKLSDFAGLFVFPLFWLAFFPKRKNIIYVLVAAFFTFWKSPYSQGLIDTVNSLDLVTINRVVDYTDLFALLILPSSYYYDTLPITTYTNRFAQSLVIFISLFAFTATTFAEPTPFYVGKAYKFDVSKEELLKKMEYINQECKHEPLKTDLQDKVWLTICSRLCKPYLNQTSEFKIEMKIKEMDGEATISIIKISAPTGIICRNGSPKRKEGALDQQKFHLRIFEKELIDRLQHGKFEN